MRQNTVTFANFVCKFGRDKNLLDYVDDVIIPAFTKTHLARKHGDSSYYFINVAVENIGSEEQPIISIVGQFVKNTVLRRTQIFDPDVGLTPDEMIMESAPSSFFILRLDIHRLIYFAETPDAPEVRAFSLAAASALKAKYDGFIERELKQSLEHGLRITKKALKAQHPAPKLVVIPLTSQSDVAAFVGRYAKLQKIEFQLVRPNDEFDGQEMWRAIRETTDRLGAANTYVEHRNSDGLNKDQAIQEISDAAATGNQIIRLSGVDEGGNRLNGNNENYQLNVAVPNPPKERSGLVKRLKEIFWQYADDGDIKVDPEQARRNASEMARLQERYL